ncbi:hypothetical protein B296_00019112, partial [Ensete ventricosum]
TVPPSPVTRGSRRTRMEERPGSFPLNGESAVLMVVFLRPTRSLPVMLLTLLLDREVRALCDGGVTRPRDLYSPAVAGHERTLVSM